MATVPLMAAACVSTTFVGGFILAFIEGWQLTLVLCAMAPLMAVGGAVMMKLMADIEGQSAKMCVLVCPCVRCFGLTATVVCAQVCGGRSDRTGAAVRHSNGADVWWPEGGG